MKATSMIVRSTTAAIAVIVVLCSATSALAASSTSNAQLASHGITLAPGEQDAKVVIVGGTPGAKQSVVLTPKDCGDASCQSVVTTGLPKTATPQPLDVIPLNQTGVKVEAPVSTATPTRTSLYRRQAAPRGKSVTARAAVNVGGWDFEDQFCSNLGCAAWHMHLSSRVYYEQYYAWGSRSRYGYAGYSTCTAGSIGYSMSLQICQFYNDPSPYDLYAAAQYHVSAGWPINISQDHYIHRHCDKTGHYWLVAN